MCFHSKQSHDAQQLKNRFKANIQKGITIQPSIYNGFQHPFTPVITHTSSHEIQLLQWGLIPNWSKNKSIQKHTLNARIESLHEKPAFKDCIQNRCLIIADAFYEWQWLDNKGKNKQKYTLHLPDNHIFGFAGIWNEWVDPTTGEVINNYSIITMEANVLMAAIHNTKKRMPVIIHPDYEEEWLQGGKILNINDELLANKEDHSGALYLF